MTVEVKADETQLEEIPVSKPAESAKDVEEEDTSESKAEEVNPPKDIESEAKSGDAVVSKSSSFKEESNFLSDLKDFEKKALIDLKSKLDEAILQNKLFTKEEAKKEETKEEEKKSVAEGKDDKPAEEDAKKVEEKSVSEGQEDKPAEEDARKVEEKSAVEEKKDADEEEKKEQDKPAKETQEKFVPEEAAAIEKEKSAATEEKREEVGAEEKAVQVDKDVSLWGIPLLSSKGAEGTDVILLKFLRARDFKVDDAFEMLKNTLQWRKELNIDSILDEDLGSDLNSVGYMNGVDREGHPVCYNIYGVFQNGELYQKTFGSEESQKQFLRWRFQLMEKGIRKLHFRPGGVSSLLQITDLKNTPGLTKKELRTATKQAVGLLQDNYPEFVARNIFINVPFWYYAFNALLSPFLTQRTKSKFVFVRPAGVTETLLKYVPAGNIPTEYGGLKRENDSEFSGEDGSASEILLKGGGTGTVEIPAPEVGTTTLWDLTVLGWEVTYKEEFVPDDEGSYTVIVQKPKKISANEDPIRNSFRNNEPGKIVLTIENGSYKKKRVFYRFKTK